MHLSHEKGVRNRRKRSPIKRASGKRNSSLPVLAEPSQALALAVCPTNQLQTLGRDKGLTDSILAQHIWKSSYKLI